MTSVSQRLPKDFSLTFSGDGHGATIALSCLITSDDELDAVVECLGVVAVWMPRRDSDGSGEAGETQGGSTEGDSADPKGIARDTRP